MSEYRYDDRYGEEPYRAYRFRVRASGLGYFEGGNTIQAAFTQCSGIRATTQLVRMRTGADLRGVQSFIPAAVEYSNLVLSRGVVSDYRFLEWVFDCLPSYGLGPIKAVRHTLHVTVLNEKGEEGIDWTLYGAYPVSYELGSLDASDNQVLMENLEFAYMALERSG